MREIIAISARVVGISTYLSIYISWYIQDITDNIIYYLQYLHMTWEGPSQSSGVWSHWSRDGILPPPSTTTSSASGISPVLAVAACWCGSEQTNVPLWHQLPSFCRPQPARGHTRWHDRSHVSRVTCQACWSDTHAFGAWLQDCIWTSKQRSTLILNIDVLLLRSFWNTF